MRCFLFLPSYDVMSIMLIWQGIQKNSWVVCHCSRKNEHIFSGVSFIGFTMIQHMQCLHWPDIRFKNKEHIGYIVICFLYAGWVVLIVANYESKQTNYVLLTSLFISLRNYSSLFMPNSAVSIWIYTFCSHWNKYYIISRSWVFFSLVICILWENSEKHSSMQKPAKGFSVCDFFLLLHF